MAKLITKAFYDNGEEPIPCTLVSYDNNKYVVVKFECGSLEHIKSGYLYSNKELTKGFSEVNWFILGGGKRKDYKPRNRKTKYSVHFHHNNKDCSDFLVRKQNFTNKASAVAYASNLSGLWKLNFQVWAIHENQCSWYSGWKEVDCFPSGHALQYGGDKGRKRGSIPTCLRGYRK